MSEPLSIIGKFRIIGELGKGSMGTVYQAYDPFMRRNVAIKVTDPNSLSDVKIQRRLVELFFTEAQIYGMLNHRNILHVHDAGQDKDRYYLVMEYIENSRTLFPYCKTDNLLPVPKVVELLYQCCKGLQYAHARNVIHLDIKPGNIMLTADDQVKLADFGLSKILHPDIDHLYLENILGTPTHISPERLRREPVNHQADIYSLGVVMYGLLTGHRPFSGKNLHDLLKQIIENEPPPLKQHRPDLPDILESIVKRALAKNVEDRYRNAEDMAADLNAIHKQLVHVIVTTDVRKREKLERLKKLRFFGEFFEIELSEVINASEWLEYSVGQVIISEGDLDDSFYVVVDGEVSVIVEKKCITSLRAGDCFGEMAYISKRPRTASIEAGSEVTALRINNKMLEKMSVYCQLKFTKAFLNTLIARLSGINWKLAGEDGRTDHLLSDN